MTFNYTGSDDTICDDCGHDSDPTGRYHPYICDDCLARIVAEDEPEQEPPC